MMANITSAVASASVQLALVGVGSSSSSSSRDDLLLRRDEIARLLQSSGSLCMVSTAGGSHDDLDCVQAMRADTRFTLRNRIVFGNVGDDHFCGTILWYTMGNNDYVFNLDEIRVPAKYPGKRAYRGPKAGKPSGNPLGKNPSDVWLFESGADARAHALERCICALSNKADLVIQMGCDGVDDALVTRLERRMANPQ